MASKSIEMKRDVQSGAERDRTLDRLNAMYALIDQLTFHILANPWKSFHFPVKWLRVSCISLRIFSDTNRIETA
jgi:hypothetical protein